MHGSLPACGSPCLFAACRALPRLETPRHPPCALSCLTFLYKYRLRNHPQTKTFYFLFACFQSRLLHLFGSFLESQDVRFYPCGSIKKLLFPSRPLSSLSRVSGDKIESSCFLYAVFNEQAAPCGTLEGNSLKTEQCFQMSRPRIRLSPLYP